MKSFALEYLGHREGASLSYFTGAAVDLVAGHVIEVPSEGLTLGRSATATLRVASSQVARHHARIAVHPEGLVVTDLSSTNGTMLNDVRLAPDAPTVARPGDRLTLAEGFFFRVIELERPRPRVGDRDPV